MSILKSTRAGARGIHLDLPDFAMSGFVLGTQRPGREQGNVLYYKGDKNKKLYIRQQYNENELVYENVFYFQSELVYETCILFKSYKIDNILKLKQVLLIFNAKDKESKNHHIDKLRRMCKIKKEPKNKSKMFM